MAKIDDSEYRKELGSRLKEICREKGKDLAALEELFGTPKSTMSQYWRGIGRPSPALLLQMSEEFGINIAWIIEGDKRKKYISDLVEEQSFVIRDSLKNSLSKYGVRSITDDRIGEIVDIIKDNEELLETVWHLVKANQGMKNLKKKGES